MNERTRIIKKAGWIALTGNLALSASKIAIGMIAQSLAVLSDGIDSATDVLISIMTLVAGRVSSKPGDREHPYGHGRAETIVSAIISFIVFFAGAQIFFNALGEIMKNQTVAMPSPMALWVTVVSIAGKLGLSWSQFHYGKKSGSMMLMANGKNMRGDVVTSAGVLVGLALTFLTGIPMLDKVLAMAVALWILKNAIQIFMEANTELMDGTKDNSPYQGLFAAIAKIPAAGNPHRVRLRKMGSMIVADMDIEVDPSMSVQEAHKIAIEVEKSIKSEIPEIYDIIIHIEPKGNVEEEKFGLRAEDADITDEN